MISSLDIIVVNWNAGHHLRDCIQSIVATKRDGVALDRVVVVDNASVDRSTEGLEGIELPLTLISNCCNRGFGAACNQGALGSTADYLLFLNPDIRLFSDSLTGPIHAMERPENAKIGICGVQLIDEVGRVSPSCARFPDPPLLFAKVLGLDRLFPRHVRSHAMMEWDHRTSRQVDQVIGAFFLVRRSLFEHLGGFDERFFLYFEEVDFSYRAHVAGWSSYYIADARAYHRGMVSSDQVKAARLMYVLRSRIQYGFKHFGWPAAWGIALGTLLIEPVTRLGLAVGRRSRIEMRETLEGYAKLWRAASRRAKRGTWGP